MPDLESPYKVERFKVDLGSIGEMDFVEVKMPNSSTQVNEYRTGSAAATDMKLWGGTEYDDLVMVRGADSNSKLLEWREKVDQGNLSDAREEISVTLQDESGEPGPRWEFTAAWPREYHPPTLTTSQSQIAMEGIVIAFESMKRSE